MDSRSNNNWTKWHHIFHKKIFNDAKFIPKEIQLLISVSGGQDSMALLTLLDDIKDKYKWSINVWHGDHKWHSNSGQFAKNIKNYCSQKNINFYSDIANKRNVCTEETAREWRYKKLSKKASEILNTKNVKSVYVLTGHTSTDSTETFLLNLARGSNFAGLGGIPKKRLLNDKYVLVRPFLIFTRDETSKICKDLKIPFWEDPTNSDISLKRNFIRHKVIYELEKFYPGCSSRINTFINHMREVNEERSELCDLAIQSCISEKGIKRSILINLGEQARSTILYSLLNKKCIKQISSKNITDLSEQIIKKHQGEKSFPNGITVIWNKNFITIGS
tara:strand:+ start:2371 stop:3369 length:999 start_codon:yes stop_codon:yes gene_type:complete